MPAQPGTERFIASNVDVLIGPNAPTATATTTITSAEQESQRVTAASVVHGADPDDVDHLQRRLNCDPTAIDHRFHLVPQRSHSDYNLLESNATGDGLDYGYFDATRRTDL